MLYGNLIPVDCEVEVQPVSPGETAILQVEFVAPREPGTYRSDWRLYSPDGKWFGQRIWCKIVVDLAAEEVNETVQSEEQTEDDRNTVVQSTEAERVEESEMVTNNVSLKSDEFESEDLPETALFKKWVSCKFVMHE